MLIIGIILFGMVAGGIAQLILGGHPRATDWTLAFVTGLLGSFVGGLIGSLLSGDGFALRPSGMIGSILGAVILTAAYYGWQRRKRHDARVAQKRAARSGNPAVRG